MHINTMARQLKVKVGEDDAPPRAPRVILYVPPSGRAIHADSVEQASEVAALWAAEHPGRTVAVYELAGFAHVPIKPASFTPASEADEAGLQDGQPLSAMFDEIPVNGADPPTRRDLTEGQQEQLQRVRDIMRDETGEAERFRDVE